MSYLGIEPTAYRSVALPL